MYFIRRLPMFRKLADHFKRFGRITAGTKISDRKVAGLKLALMGRCPQQPAREEISHIFPTMPTD
ncbi:MAG: hypothetical protein ACYSR1_07485, partial [Planctomycetota bacterium]